MLAEPPAPPAPPVVLSDRIEAVSVTEIGKFRECRRAWRWEEVLGLVPVKPDERLWFGGIVHHALQTYASTHGDLKSTIDSFCDHFATMLPELQNSYGTLWQYMEPLIKEYWDLGQVMLTNYSQFDRQMGLNMDTVSLEQRVWVPIRNATGRTTLKGSPKLTARMDRLVAVKKDLYLLDYKTGAQVWTKGKGLELDDQITGYSYVYWRLTGELFRGVIYETLLKKVPEEPRILQNGTLSTAKDQNTLPGLYRRKMIEMDLMKSPKHREALAAIEQKGWDPYYSREITSRNLDQVLAYEEHLFYTFKEMQAAALDERKAYPSPSSIHCPRCPFLTACLAKEDGSDYQSILNNQFTVRKQKRW